MAAMTNRSRIGVFGGTFDPVHLGHLIVASEIHHAMGLQQILFVPAAMPPHKPDPRRSPVEDRLSMLERAIAGDRRFALSRVDVDRPGPHFTVDLLRILSGEFPEAELFFVMGSDSLRDLPTWRDPAGIAVQANLAVAARLDVDLDLASLYLAVPELKDRIHQVAIPEIGVSSSHIRNRVRDGRPITYQVTEATERYILEHGLYLD